MRSLYTLGNEHWHGRSPLDLAACLKAADTYGRARQGQSGSPPMNWLLL